MQMGTYMYYKLSFKLYRAQGIIFNNLLAF